jgi:hypothetical protein
MFPAMLQSRWWDTPTPLYRRSAIDAAGAWLPLRIEEDWEYDARIASQDIRLHFVEDWVAQVRRHEEGHLSGRADAATLRDRAVAHERIFRHAQAWIAGDSLIPPSATAEDPLIRLSATREDPLIQPFGRLRATFSPAEAGEKVSLAGMRRFARELFLLSRQCGAAGLVAESRKLFGLAREASGPGASGLQFRAYHALADTIGWSAAGKIATLADRLRW